VQNFGTTSTIGFARSTDFGMTWPVPIDAEYGGKGRRPVLKMNTPEPMTPFSTYMGNAIPSAFVEPVPPSSFVLQPHYIYVTYIFAEHDGYLRVARANLDERPVTFTKWYNGSFSQPGLGGSDSGVTPTRGCEMTGNTGEYQIAGQISYNTAINQHLLTFVCVQSMGTPATPYQAGWYYSTASSLEQQNWTTPQLITGSLMPVNPACNMADKSGDSFDGWYPSFMSPDHRAGHLGKTGQVFYLSGCNTGARSFKFRTFTITTGP
jgi:hypothetical protein